jgi:hypothetical protein
MMKMRRKLNRIFLITVVIIILAATVPGVMAFEGHVIDVTAHVKDDMRGTHTWGWWAEHPLAAKWVIEEVGTIDMGWLPPITNVNQIMGIFYAHSNKDTDNSTREPLCKDKIKAAKKVLAALLNSYCPNGAFLPVSEDYIRTIMNGSNTVLIGELHDLLNAYNEFYVADNRPLCIPIDTGNADPDLAKSWALEEFADCP